MPFSHKIFLGTFHKSGTRLTAKIFREVASLLGVNFYPYNPQEAIPTNWDIFFCPLSTFLNTNLLDCKHKGIILVRDPRDVIISATHYHQHANEPWLHRPIDEFNGSTYQEKLNSLQNLDEQFLFTMDNLGRYGGRDPKNMLKALDADQEHFRIIQLESLLTDYDLSQYRNTFRYLSVPEEKIEACLEIAYKHSIFSKSKEVRGDAHIRSGAINQYYNEFNNQMLEEYYQRYGDLASQLGYKSK